MRRPTPFSALFSLLRAGSVGAIVLAGILSCTDTSSIAGVNDGLIYVKGSDGVIRVRVQSVDIVIPDSVKQAQLAANSAAGTSMVPIGPSMTVVRSPTSSANVAAQSCGGGGFAGYTKSEVAFAPDSIPNIAPYPLKDDGYIPDSFVSLGFNFSFEGNTYNKVNVYSNGFLLFGAAPGPGFSDAGFIPSTANPKNIIALGWTDWSPQLAPDAIRWETRGTAPNRRFILQFNNVPEYFGASSPGAVVANAGRFTSQVVLSEGSNDITIYTTQMTLTNTSHWVTQAIENADGTNFAFDSVLNTVTGIRSARVHNHFSLQNDAVRFSLIQTKDLVAPTMTAPVDIVANNDPGLASAVVAVSAPPTSDNCGGTPTVTWVRSDGATSLSDPYHVGVTTITWTAKDDAGNTSSATQTVTVLDIEAPVFGLADGSILEFNATSPSGATVTFNTGVKDNVGVTSLSCAPASGSLFAVGPTPVNCTASDAAGNTSHDSFTVRVIGAHEQLFNLLQYVIGLNLPNGTSEPLINQLRAAYSQDVYGACNKLGDFLNMVQKKSGNIPPDEKAVMISDGTRVLNATGCSSSISASISSRALPHF